MTAATFWAETDSAALDDIASRAVIRRPIEREHKLWAALATDRAEAPYQPPAPVQPTQSARAKSCQCGKPFRPARSRAADHPGAVLHHGRGMCAACYKNAFITEPL